MTKSIDENKQNQSIPESDLQTGYETLRIAYILVSEAIEWELDDNPKRHDLGKIADSITENGFRDPPAFDANLNGGKGGLVFGNGRTEALAWMESQGRSVPRGIALTNDGRWAMPVLFGVDARSEAAAKRFSLDHNLLTMAGGEYTALDMSRMFEPGSYLAMLEDLAGFDQLPLMVGGDDLDLLMEELAEPNQFATPSAEDDEEAAAELVEKAESGEIQSRVKPGEVWACGRHRICCGDSTEEQQVKRLLGDRKVDMCWSDPPYGISIVATNVTVGGGEAYDIPFGGVKNRKGYVGGGNCNRTPIAVCQERKRKKELGLGSIGGAKPFGSKDVRGSIGASNIVKVNKYFPVAGDDSIDTAIASVQLCAELFPDAVQIWWGGNYYAHALPPSSCWIVWDKENTGNFADAELAWTNHKSAVRIFRHMWNGMLKDSEKGERRVHPTQKPQALSVWCFEKYGSSNDVIFDPFLGSGISLLAAQKLEGDRTVYGMELSENYCEIVLQRWSSFTGQEPVLIGSIFD